MLPLASMPSNMFFSSLAHSSIFSITSQVIPARASHVSYPSVSVFNLCLDFTPLGSSHLTAFQHKVIFEPRLFCLLKPTSFPPGFCSLSLSLMYNCTVTLHKIPCNKTDRHENYLNENEHQATI